MILFENFRTKIQWKLRGSFGRASVGRSRRSISVTKGPRKKRDVSKSKLDTESKSSPAAAVAKKFPKFPCGLCKRKFYHQSDLNTHHKKRHQSIASNLLSLKTYRCGLNISI